MADVTSTLTSWSSTAASNLPANSAAVGPNTLADNQRVIQAVVRAALAGDGTIASATTTDLSTVNDGDITVTGTTTITGLGTLTAGIKKVLTFSGALTLTHNATSLILPGAANITTAAGDVAIMRSLGSGNWKCISFTRAASLPTTSADIQVQLATAFTTGGTATAFTLTPAPAITANAANQRFRVKFNAAAGTTPTLAVSGQAALNLKYRDSTGGKQAITATQVPINWASDVVNDGTDWVVENVAIIPGVTTNSSAPTGYIGEYVESIVAQGAAVSLTTGVVTNITSISLTAGDWDVSGVIIMDSGATTNVTRVMGGINSTSGTVDTSKSYYSHVHSGYVPGGGQFRGMPLNTSRFSLSATTTIYLLALSNFTVSTCTAYGTISARRVR